MRNQTVIVVIIGAVLLLKGCGYLSRHLLRKRRRLSRFKRLLSGESSLLPTPLGYEELHLAGKQTENDLQGLTMGPRLGFGSSGVVYHGRWKGARVAVKILNHDLGDSRIGATIAREVVIGAALSHPNIVVVYLVSTKRLMTTNRLETCIIMEYCDQGTLLQKHKQIWELCKIDDAAALRWCLRTLIDIAGAMEHMHSMGLIHGDLKCNNILLQSTRAEARGFRCKVADMGCSRLLTAAREAIMTGTYGAPTYAAPEVLKEGSLTQASDVYSFSIIAWHLISLGDSFFSMNIGELYVRIVDREERPLFPDQTNEALRQLIQACWNPIPSQRPSVAAILPRLVTMYDENS